LREVEVAREIAQQLQVLPHERTGVGASVGSRVDARAAEEVVLDELQVRIEAQRLVVDVPPPRVRADHEGRDPHAVAGDVDGRWGYVIVEAAPVVPREEDRG
jgi:hypothetical protein